MSVYTITTTSLTGTYGSSSSVLAYSNIKASGYNWVGRKTESGYTSAAYHAIIIDFSSNQTYLDILKMYQNGATINSIKMKFTASKVSNYAYSFAIGLKAANNKTTSKVSSIIEFGTIAQGSSINGVEYNITSLGLSTISMFCAGDTGKSSTNAGTENVTKVTLIIDINVNTIHIQNGDSLKTGYVYYSDNGTLKMAMVYYSNNGTLLLST